MCVILDGTVIGFKCNIVKSVESQKPYVLKDFFFETADGLTGLFDD